MVSPPPPPPAIVVASPGLVSSMLALSSRAATSLVLLEPGFYGTGTGPG
jgi:hypothetical protein